jgi:hypothetical protein
VEVVEPEEAPKASAKKKPKAPKLNEEPPPPPPTTGRTVEPPVWTPPNGSNRTGLETKATRKLLPRGFVDDPPGTYLGVAGWIPDHDLKVVLQEVEDAWGGGSWRLEFFENGKQIGQRDEVVSGEPKPLRDEPPATMPMRGGYGGVHGPGSYPPITGGYGGALGSYGGYPPPQIPPYSQPYPPFQPPPTTREDTLRAEAERAKAELERERKRREEEAREAKLEQRFSKMEDVLAKLAEAAAGPKVDPMATYMQLVRDQAEKDREREERRLREEREARERERAEKEKAEREEREERRRREEKEERRREEERREKAEREEREERRRAEERKERLEREERERQREEDRRREQQQREDRLAKEHRDLISTISTKDPLESVLKLIEVQKKLAGGKDEDDDDETVAEQVGRGAAALFEGIGATLQARAEAKNEEQERVNLGSVGATTPAPQLEAKKEESPDKRVGRLGFYVATLMDSYNAKVDPSSAASALVGAAKAFEAQGQAGAIPDLGALGGYRKRKAQDIVNDLNMIKPMLGNQKLAAAVNSLQEVVQTGDGYAWVVATLNALMGGAGEGEEEGGE